MTIAFRRREFKGSRLRCLLMTQQSDTDVAGFLTSLVAQHAVVTAADHWAPRGFLNPVEPKLGETEGFLCENDRGAVASWWLARPGRANTPNWDLVSTCQIGKGKGLVLVEAKAHEAEFADDRCGAKDKSNLKRIADALSKAETAWNGLMPGFSLSVESHYQLSNRFAFAWKLASMGTPVVLVYLGFLNAYEMIGSGRVLLRDDEQWRKCVLKGANGTIPPDAWGKEFDVTGTPLTVLIRSADVSVHAALAGNGANS